MFKNGRLYIPDSVKERAKIQRINKRKFMERQKDETIRYNPAYKIYVETTSESKADKLTNKISKMSGVIIYTSTTNDEGRHRAQFYSNDKYVICFDLRANEAGGEVIIDWLQNQKYKFDVY